MTLKQKFRKFKYRYFDLELACIAIPFIIMAAFSTFIWPIRIDQKIEEAQRLKIESASLEADRKSSM